MKSDSEELDFEHEEVLKIPDHTYILVLYKQLFGLKVDV